VDPCLSRRGMKNRVDVVAQDEKLKWSVAQSAGVKIEL
jgi:hypothetical protein